jgi:hypothetical protein
VAPFCYFDYLVEQVVNEIEHIRARHGLRALKNEEEGSPTARLPHGVYGFTYSPGQDETPIFANKAYHNFEVHKLEDGSERLIGYLTEPEIATLEARKPGTVVHLYPDVWAESTHLVSVDLTATVRLRRTPPRDDGNPYRIVFE